MEKLIGLMMLVFCAISCSDSCTECVQETETIEVCEDSGIVFTDVAGDTLSTDMYISWLETQGYICD